MATIFFSLVFLFFFILVLKMIIYPWWTGPEPYVDDFVEHHHTTTTTTTVVNEQPQQPQWNVVGNLKRKKSRNGQFYVIDPVDEKQMYLNDTDDMYEDADGKIWRLV